jgi:hypothetical protein
MIVRNQVEGADDLSNVHAIQDKYSLTPISTYAKKYVAPVRRLALVVRF